MAFSLMEFCFSPSALALALFNFQSIYLAVSAINPLSTALFKPL